MVIALITYIAYVFANVLVFVSNTISSKSSDQSKRPFFIFSMILLPVSSGCTPMSTGVTRERVGDTSKCFSTRGCYLRSIFSL